ncbi:MAG: acyl-CoA dehydrogenase family protein [Pseudomonadota bacterium]|nr:acyl-CoA dehydrogenase family protein [Pseudomonadota bacterium]
MSFIQQPPRLGNQYSEDRVLRSYLRRALPADMLREIESALIELGGLSGGELYRVQLADRLNEPVLTQWDAWGKRIDHIELTQLWRRAQEIAPQFGIVAVAYERAHGEHSRIHQFALAYLFAPSTDVYACPLAMTDGAARALLASANQSLIERAVPHLTSRDPAQFWTSGQWMTENIGGSDLGMSETEARRDEQGLWRLHGRKWFTSAATSQMALTLARPMGNPDGARGLALFYVEPRDAECRLQNIEIQRLKDKLGTRKVPTAELLLTGTPALPVAGLSDGVRAIAPMLNLTRTWNAVSAVATMRRGLALARDYAKKRIAFGSPLARKPLHLDTLACLQAEFEAAFHLTFHVVELIGRDEARVLSPSGKNLLRLLTPIVKLTTAQQAVAATSEILEAFGGAGYIEDTGLPLLLRDAQVFSIWEGTTNVLALDALRVANAETLSALKARVAECAKTNDVRLIEPGRHAIQALDKAAAWFDRNAATSALEAGARRFALTLGRSYALALMVRHAQWSLDHEHDARAAIAAQRFRQGGVDLTTTEDIEASRALAMDEE